MQLETVVVHHNKLQSLAPLVYLPRLRHISFHNNPLDVQSIQVQRLLARNEAKNASSVYADGQNVHNAHIQKTVCESIQRLLTDPKPVFSIEDITKAGLDVIATELLLIYCADTCVHSAHLLTYAELLGYVWARICRSEHKVELFKILGEQVCESKDLCLTGRFNRTVSVLMGFYDDIMICISDSSRITAIVLAARAKIEVYDPTQHLELATKLLTEAGYGADMIEPWLRAISEP
ncbi:Hypothetical protein MVR_LOCUS144 [uncultured virus]|nr:Hypothetical protein MVR_LOCUS144 [uncultured virus]